MVLLVSVFLNASCIAESEKAIVKRIRTAPQRNLENVVIDGTGKIAGFDSSEGSFQGFDDRRVGNSRVSVSTVAWLTLAMAAATGLGSVPFFFVELEPQYAGVCNGLAAGVMLAASFDLIQEGQIYGSGNWVVLGILAGGIFILLCKKVICCVFSHFFLYMITNISTIFYHGYLFC